MSFRPAALLPFVLALVLAACDGGGGGGAGGVTVSASKIALATVFYPGTPTRGAFSAGSVTVAVRTGSAASAARVDLIVPETMRGIAAQILTPIEGGALVRIVWREGTAPGKATLRVVVKGETVTVPVEFVAPTGLSTRNVTLSDQDTHVRPTLLLPGTTETAQAVLGVTSSAEALTLALVPSATATLAAPVTVPAGTSFAVPVRLALRMGASVAPGTTDTLLLSVTTASGVLVSSGLVSVRATAPIPAGTRIAHVPFDRGFWPLADTTGIRNAYRFGSTRFGTAQDFALRADGRVFFGGDTTRTGRIPGAFRAVAIGGAAAIDATGGVWTLTNASGGATANDAGRFGFPVQPATIDPSWGKAVAIGSGVFTYSTDDAIYRTVIGYADGWVRAESASGVPNLPAIRVPSAPTVVGAMSTAVVAMTADGAVYTSGTDGGSGAQTATRVAGLPPMARITIAQYSVIGVDRSGVTWAWGLLDNRPSTSGCPFSGGVGQRLCASPVRY